MVLFGFGLGLLTFFILWILFNSDTATLLCELSGRGYSVSACYGEQGFVVSLYDPTGKVAWQGSRYALRAALRAALKDAHG